VLLAFLVVNLATVWWRSVATGRLAGAYVSTAGAVAIGLTTTGLAAGLSAAWGIGLTFAGSAIATWHVQRSPSALFITPHPTHGGGRM
jgi:hypothetical protein